MDKVKVTIGGVREAHRADVSLTGHPVPLQGSLPAGKRWTMPAIGAISSR